MANGRTGFLAYETRFWFPSKESRSYSPFYYSYEVFQTACMHPCLCWMLGNGCPQACKCMHAVLFLEMRSTGLIFSKEQQLTMWQSAALQAGNNPAV